MHTYSLLAPAKVNLYLEILGDRADGFHELAMILQSITLADRLELRANGTEQFRLLCDHPQVPTDESNLAYRAAALMAKTFPNAFNTYGGVDISLDKRIPIGAGLAGGSTNAAAVLVGLDLMWHLGLTQSEIQDLGAILGSDVPFCVSGGTAIATGRGERLAQLPSLNGVNLVLAKFKSLSVSTPWAYKTYRQQFGHTYLPEGAPMEGRRRQVNSGAIVSAIGQRDLVQVGQYLYNDLEKVVLPEYPQVQQLRDSMRSLSPLGGMMSGSGPSVFGLAESAEQAETMRSQLRQQFPDPDLEIWVTQTGQSGIRVAA